MEPDRKASSYALPCSCCCCILIMSSIRKMVMAASVANLIDFTFDMPGSSTPAARLSRHLPSCRSRPIHFNSLRSGCVCEALCIARSFATRSVASSAALTASVFGMTNSARANSAIASCSREPSCVAKFSR